MNRFFLLVFFILFSLHASSQSLEGEWKGSFSSNAIFENETVFALHFTLKKDSSYKVYSHSLIPDGSKKVTVVCRVVCKLVGADSLYLEEVEQVKPLKILSNCFQVMHLKIDARGKEMILTGTWATKLESCSDSGTVSLKKIK